MPRPYEIRDRVVLTEKVDDSPAGTLATVNGIMSNSTGEQLFMSVILPSGYELRVDVQSVALCSPTDVHAPPSAQEDLATELMRDRRIRIASSQ